MNPARPETTHVAVKDGQIIGTGTLGELKKWGEYKLDEQFSGKYLMPGLVEGHSHVMEGTLWRYSYCGYFDRKDPDGTLWAGLKNKEAVISRLKEAENLLEDPNASLPGWQLDPIYFGNERLTRQDLDNVSTTRAVGVLHASGHIMNVNSKALELAGMLKHGINHPGVPLGDDGLPTGELKGPDIMTPVGVLLGLIVIS